jgi:hypothetical protein
MRNTEDLFAALARSAFRRRFRLREADAKYLRDKGIDLVLQHAADLIAQRLAPAHPVNDGKQTPFRGHPVFVAQHATATCCRTCLNKWHHIPAGQELTVDEQRYVVGVIAEWLRRQPASGDTQIPANQLGLWDAPG